MSESDASDILNLYCFYVTHTPYFSSGIVSTSYIPVHSHVWVIAMFGMYTISANTAQKSHFMNPKNNQTMGTRDRFTAGLTASMSVSNLTTINETASSDSSDEKRTNLRKVKSDPVAKKQLSSRSNNRLIDERNRLIQEALDGEILSRRPDRISLTFHRESKEIPIWYWFELMKHRDGFVRVTPTNLLTRSLPKFILRQGDILESINSFRCKGKSVSKIMEYAEAQKGRITLFLSTSRHSQRGFLHQSIVLRPEKECELGLSLGQTKEGMIGLEKMSSVGWFDPRKSLISEKDILVGINDMDCTSLQASEAKVILDSKAIASPYMSILCISATAVEKLLNVCQKSAIAVSGGTLIGVGAIMLATPLHCVGQGVLAGGVATLGTKFDAPKRAMNRAMHSFRTNKSIQGGDCCSTIPEEITIDADSIDDTASISTASVDLSLM